MRNDFLGGKLNLRGGMSTRSYNKAFRSAHPEYFDPYGLMVFCGPQGAGKTISAVRYCRSVLEKYPDALFCSNVAIKGLEDRTIPYDGMKSLCDLENGYAGVLYLIDEIHLEFNSLESKSISIEEMTEFAQQRKQRKHIVGTSQVFMRLAKPLREQIKDVVLCRTIMGFIQCNELIDGTTAHEEEGRLIAESKGVYYWCHTPELYESYDTYAKMRRYRQAWSSRSSAPVGALYSGEGSQRYRGKSGSRRI